MKNKKREDFIQAIGDFLKLDLKNEVTYEFLTVETGWIRDEWCIEFIGHMGTVKTDYKKPIEIFTSAITSFKKNKYEKHYNSLNEKVKTLVDKLQTTFRCFENTNPPADIKYSQFQDTNKDDGTKKPSFDQKQLNVLEHAGSWNYLYGRKNDTYGLLTIIENAYKKSIENYIKDTAVKLGNVPQLEKPKTNLQLGAMVNELAQGKRVGA